MPVNNRSSIVSIALKSLVGAVAGAVLISANAAGLGKLTVLSALGQPLRAEIELTAVTPEEASGLSARLASQDAFRTANIDFNPALSSLQFELEQRNGRQFIRISSPQPLNEPFVDLLLELNWNGGRMVREYTFLLDPPEMRTAQSPQVAAPVDLGQARTPTTASVPPVAPVASVPSPGAAPTQPAAPKPRAKPVVEEYTVKQGDTLSRIATQVKPTNVSLDVMLVALYRANPEAFSGNNMNRLKSGQILAVPDAEGIRAAAGNAGEARGVVVAHARDFNAYRAKLAGQVAGSTPARDSDAGQSSSGKISAKVEEKPNAVNAARDKLTLSKGAGEKAVPGAPAGKTGAAGAAEEQIARQKQVDDAASRVKELEKNVNDLEKLMEVKNKTAAEIAAPAASAPPAAAPAAENAPQKTAPVVPPRKLAEKSIVDSVGEHASTIGLGIAAVVAGVAGVLIARRRKKFVVPPGEPGMLGSSGDRVPEPDPVAPSPFAATAAGAAAADATGTSVFNSNFAASASQLDSNEVDPVAEADVYIAYGRDAQAEEILKEALRNHPERHAVRLKLLEIYANRKDARSFESQASELYTLTRGQGEEWAQAAQLGRTLEPDNPLYTASAGLADAGNTGGAGAGGYGAVPLAASAGSVAAATAAAAYAYQDDGDADSLNAPAAESAFGVAPADAGADGLADPYGADRERDHEVERELADPLAHRPDETVARAPAEPLDHEAAVELPQAADATISPASLAAADPHAYDLHGLDFAPSGTAAPAPAPLSASPAAPFLQDDSFNLSFDAPPPAPAPANTSDKFDDPSMDFSFDLPADPAATAMPGAAETTAPEAPEVPTQPVTSAATDESRLPPPPSADAAMADTPAPGSSAPEFDLSGIDLDLDHRADAASAPDVTGADAEPMSALHMEMDTKLDLAVAYQEIGDKEGARELLDEVLRGGNDEQVAKANAMKAQLG